MGPIVSLGCSPSPFSLSLCLHPSLLDNSNLLSLFLSYNNDNIHKRTFHDPNNTNKKQTHKICCKTPPSKQNNNTPVTQTKPSCQTSAPTPSYPIVHQRTIERSCDQDTITRIADTERKVVDGRAAPSSEDHLFARDELMRLEEPVEDIVGKMAA